MRGQTPDVSTEASVARLLLVQFLTLLSAAYHGIVRA